MSKQIKNKIISTISLISFLGIIIFSFISTMDHTMSTGQNIISECPLATLANVMCPTNNSGLIEHHISIYRSFYNVPLSKNILSLLGLIIFFSLFYLFNKRGVLNKDKLLADLLKRHIKKWQSSLKQNKATNWLALFENSPSFSFKT